MSPPFSGNKQILNKDIQTRINSFADCWERGEGLNESSESDSRWTFPDSLCWSRWNLLIAPPLCHHRRIWHMLSMWLYYTFFSTPVNTFSWFVVSNILAKFMPFSSLQFDWYYGPWSQAGKMIPSVKERMHIESTKHSPKPSILCRVWLAAHRPKPVWENFFRSLPSD